MAGVSWLGRIHHQVHAGMPCNSGAQLGRDGLLQHGDHPRIHVHHLSIASSDATLPHVSLGAGHEADHLQTIVRSSHLHHHLLKAVTHNNIQGPVP